MGIDIMANQTEGLGSDKTIGGVWKKVKKPKLCKLNIAGSWSDALGYQ